MPHFCEVNPFLAHLYSDFSTNKAIFALFVVALFGVTTVNEKCVNGTLDGHQKMPYLTFMSDFVSSVYLQYLMKSW